jgi:predicted GIY-YIG superfamily endonuclease
MSFEKPPASYPFMDGFIRANAPSASGIYILFSTPGFTWEVIYVGDSDNVQARLLEHLNGDNACISERGPTAFICEQHDAERRQARRDELIGEYNPTCNQ